MSLKKSLQSWLAATALLALAACGGGGGSAGDSLFQPSPAGGATTSATASDLVIVLSKATVTNGGSDSVEAKITALDANRNALPGVAVSVSVDADAIAQVVTSTTDTAGAVSATLTIGNNKTPRTVTVTARASGLTRAQSFQVTNELGGSATTAADLVVVLDKATVDNSGSQSVQATITALDSNRSALAGIPVVLSVDNGAVLQASSAITEANGQIAATVSIGSNRSLRNITLTARSGAVGAAQTFQVIGSTAGGGTAASDLVVLLDRTTLSSSATTPVLATVTALDANRNALAGVPVQVTVDAGAIATVSSTTTDAAGQVSANVSLGSDKSLRTVTVTARTGALARAQTFQVTNSSGSTVAASDLVLQLNKTVINTSGTDLITATVMALDTNRNAVAGIPVTVTVDSNAVATVSAGSTNAQGVVTASIGPGGDKTARVVRVTATSGSVTKSATFEVSVTSAVTSIQASEIVLGLSTTSVSNTGTQAVTATVTALDGNRNALAGVPVQFSINNGGVIIPAGTLTGPDGTLTAVARIGVDRSNRNISVVATSGTLSRTETFQVDGASLSATLLPGVVSVPGSSGNQIQYRLIDRNANPMVGFPLTISGPGLATVTGTTGINGDYSFVYTAPGLPVGQSSTNLVVSAAAAGVSRTDTVQVGVAARDPAVGPVVSASIDPTPSVVSTNSVSNPTASRAEIRAVFLGPNNKPIENLRVVFDLNADVNTVGGSIESGAQVVYTDANGVATTAFIPGLRASPTDGVSVRACYALTGAALSCPAGATVGQSIGSSSGAVTKPLTVVSNAVSVSIGTDELIGLGTGTYTKDFVVMVVDSAGNAKADVVITPSLDLTGYYKGFYQFAGRWNLVNTLDDQQNYRWDLATTAWVTDAVPTQQPLCPGEDFDRNSSLLLGEDLNGNGALDPRKSDVSVRVISAGNKTGANGTAIIRLEYPRNYATWVDFRITVQATGVSGTEGRAVYVGTRYGVGNLPAPGTVFADENVAPAFVVSPYGRSNTCRDAK